MKRMTIILTLSFFVLGLSLGIITILSFGEDAEKTLNIYAKQLRGDVDQEIKNEVEIAVALLRVINDKVEKGEIAAAQGRKLGGDLLRSLRYSVYGDKNGYFVVDDYMGTSIVLYGSHLEGSNWYESQDTRLINGFRKRIAAGLAKDGGFTDYWFPEKGASNPTLKHSYSLAFQPFHWIVGTGVSVKEIDGLVEQRKTEITAAYHSRLLLSGSIIFFALLVSSIVLFRNIHERKEYVEFQESSLAERKALVSAVEAANETKSRFLAIMSHEIRTPLNAIIGSSQILQMQENRPKTGKFLDIIQSSAQLLLALINDILDVMKINDGKLQLKVLPFDVRELVDSVVATMEPEASRKGIELRKQVSEDVPRRLSGDSLRLQQIMVNLCGNAIKFTDRGEIEISISTEQSLPDRVMLRFKVRDTGIGITEPQIAKLFQPFFQADSMITRKTGGTGLGLAICKSLVELMGGEIGVESEYGKGSVFSFTAWFGIADATVQTSADSASEPDGTYLSGSRILLVEDNEVNVLVEKEMLEAAGAAVRVAYSGEEALWAVEETKFDAVLMDLHMPGMDGYEITEAIRMVPRHARLPVIALTADDQVQDRIRLNAAGINDYLLKPFNYSDLLDILKKWIGWAKGENAASKEGAAAEPDPVEEIQNGEKLELDGLDTDLGLKRALGKMSLYQSMLAAFFTTQNQTVDRVDRAIERGDAKDAILAVHTTRGAAGNIGAEALRQAAAALEASLREGMDTLTKGKVDDFRRELRRVLASLTAFGSERTPSDPQAGRENPEVSAPIIDAAALAPSFDEIERLLTSGSVDSLDAVERLGAQLKTSKAVDLYSRLREETANFDTDAALSTLRRIRSELAS